MAVNRKTHQAHQKCRVMNFSLEGLEGFQMHGKTVAVVGAGNIGVLAARIYLGFGMRVLYYNRSRKPELDKLNEAHGPWDGETEVGGRVVWLPMYELDPETSKPTRTKNAGSMRQLCELSDVPTATNKSSLLDRRPCCLIFAQHNDHLHCVFTYVFSKRAFAWIVLSTTTIKALNLLVA